MGSVIVKGMEMPESCYRCPMANDDFYLCGATEKYLENDSEERRPDWCPLIDIPTPHGRLADLDQMVEDYWDENHMEIDEGDLKAISQYKVVIEAEGET